MSTGQQLVGGLITIGVGVIVVAAIFQLNSKPTVANDVAGPSGIGQKTLSSLFS